MNSSWYRQVAYEDPNINRIDFRITRGERRNLIRQRVFAKALAEYFKTQRLLPNEIQDWQKLTQSGRLTDNNFRAKLLNAFAEGVLKDDMATVDDDALTGTCGQLLFQWIRSRFFTQEIIVGLPKLLTDSSKEKGIDRFEILGDQTDYSSLYFVVWEIKATDGDVASRTNEIYQMHRKRSSRLIRGIQMQLSLQYPIEQYPILGEFVRRISDYWNENSSRKRIGGAVVFDTSKNPGNVFTAFHTQFPELHSSLCRQVLLIEVPQFRKTRKKLWKYLAMQIF